MFLIATDAGLAQTTARTILTVADCECGVMHVGVAFALRATFDAEQKTDKNWGTKREAAKNMRNDSILSVRALSQPSRAIRGLSVERPLRLLLDPNNYFSMAQCCTQIV